MIRPDYMSPNYKRKIDLSGNVHYDSILRDMAKRVLVNTDIGDYPHEYLLYEAISSYYDTNMRNIAIGHGATELIERLIRLYSNYKFYIVSPTFEMVQVYCEIHKVNYEIISKKDIWNITDDKGILYVATPNGQNGSYIPIVDLLNTRFYKVIADRVYSEFSPHPTQRIIYEYIISVHSISKTLGLAGLRVGWVVAFPSIIQQLQEIRSNYITNTAATILVPALIYETKNVVNRMIETKYYLQNKYECNHSNGNYVLFKNMNELTLKYGYRLTEGGYRMALMDMQTYRGLSNE